MIINKIIPNNHEICRFIIDFFIPLFLQILLIFSIHFEKKFSIISYKYNN